MAAGHPFSPVAASIGETLKSKMARATGLEPAASGVTGRRSNQLSYARSPSMRLPRPTRRAVAVRPRYGFARSKSSFAGPKASRRSVGVYFRFAAGMVSEDHPLGSPLGAAG